MILILRVLGGGMTELVFQRKGGALPAMLSPFQTANAVILNGAQRSEESPYTNRTKCSIV